MAKDAGTNERIRQQLIQSRSSEPKRFDRAPLPYPKDFDRELDQFIEVVKIAFSGNVPSARQRLSNIVHQPMVSWYDEIGQHVGDVRYQLLNSTKPYRKKALSNKKRDMGEIRVRRIAERDGYRCGYCGIRVVEPALLRKVQMLLGRDVFPSKTKEKGSSNLDYHGIWITMAITLDHIEPFAINADDSDNNLVTCCWGCNFGKYDYTLNELGLLPPQASRAVSGNWFGLRNVI